MVVAAVAAAEVAVAFDTAHAEVYLVVHGSLEAAAAVLRTC